MTLGDLLIKIKNKITSLTTTVNGKVSKTGDTMTGRLVVSVSGTQIRAKNDSTTKILAMHSSTAGDQGLYAYDAGGTTGHWMIYENSSGVMTYKGIADYIAEQGTSGDWTYIKLKNGICACWGKISLGSVAITNSGGGAYYSNAVTVNLPITFNNEPKHWENISAAGVWATEYSRTKSTIQFRLNRNASATSTYIAMILVVG